jgi:hypothetical protein
MWQNTPLLTAALRRGRASQVTSYALEHVKTRTRACVYT